MEDQLLKSSGGAAATAAAAAAAANAAAPRLNEPTTANAMPIKIPLTSLSCSEPDTPQAATTNSSTPASRSPQSKPQRRGKQVPAQQRQQTQQPQQPLGQAPAGVPQPAGMPPQQPGDVGEWAGGYGMYPNTAAAMQYGMSYPAPWMPNMYSGFGMHPMYPGMAAMMPPGIPPFGVMPQQAAVPQQLSGSSPKNMGPKAAGGQGGSRERRRRGKKKKGARERVPSPAAVSDDDSNPNRSVALQEVRRQGTRCKMTLKEVLPNLLEFAQDHHGSRFLQQKLEEADPGEKQEVFAIIVPEAANLSSDAFGGFVIQKLFDIGTPDQRKQLAAGLKKNVLRLSNEALGCRVIQKAIQHASRESQQMIASELGKSVVSCIESMHGNHVIQKCIEQMPPESVDFIIKAVEEQTERMASHMYGCRVIQRLLEHCASSQLQKILEHILKSIPALAQDPYGNYVVQHMLEHGRREDKKRIVGIIQDHVVDFAMHKCSSNVVEKCFEIATVGEHAYALEEERQKLMHTVLGDPNDVNPPLYQMMDNRFGNYIVQRMIEHSRGPESHLLRERLMHVEPQLRSSVNGKHILTALNKASPC